MGNLKKENVTKCFSLLKEFIDGADPQNSNKGIAVLALDQLQKITAGTDNDLFSACIDLPRADVNPILETACIDLPRADIG
ncbi:MAG: hypothetical protein KAT34_15780 [Candidatus Aminicenantes bacterium]|nr:hypothetical protein [Candidatus Aminicenantes bacterium]